LLGIVGGPEKPQIKRWPMSVASNVTKLQEIEGRRKSGLDIP
jgi:hypothetical protein